MDKKSSEPVWLKTAQASIGVKEYPGAANNPLIMRMATKAAKFLGIKYDGDHVPWCGLFASYCMVENGFIPPSIAIRASEWAKWGVALSKPAPGAVLVFTREGGGHVGFYISEDAQYFHVLGGNQGDAVSIIKIARDRCTAIRWPKEIPLPTKGPILKKFDGKVSTNEA